jgi:hypothetical protein
MRQGMTASKAICELYQGAGWDGEVHAARPFSDRHSLNAAHHPRSLPQSFRSQVHILFGRLDIRIPPKFLDHAKADTIGYQSRGLILPKDLQVGSLIEKGMVLFQQE